MRICYAEEILGRLERNTTGHMDIINKAIAICEDIVVGQGYDLTLRQLYYQGVARGWWVNTERSYKNLGNILNDARYAGLLDWDWMTDRTRDSNSRSTWDSPLSIMRAAAR